MIKAFVGHSFEDVDKPVISEFKDYFESLKKTMPFNWENAQERRIDFVKDKVFLKMEGKNLFIGILTKSDAIIDKSKISPAVFSRNKFVYPIEGINHGPSYWIIQESGYAIGKGMKVLFLYEKGVKKISGLHADAEWIEFERGSESKCFRDLNEAIGNFEQELKGGDGTVSQTDMPSEKGQEEIKLDTKETKQLNFKEIDESDYEFELSLTLWKQEDDKFENLKNAILDKYKDNEKKTINWKAKTLNLEARFRKKSVIQELRELRKINPDDLDIIYYIGQELKKYENYLAAVEEFKLCAEKSDTIGGKISFLASASECLARSGHSNEAINILANLLDGTQKDEDRYYIYKCLANTMEILKDDDKYITFAEKALDINPGDNSLRFSLAYKYEDLNKNELSLFHYKILIRDNMENANLNNIAVAYGNLDMHAKAVKYYRMAADKDYTLSMANLAQMYMDKGFIEDADALLTKATKIKDYKKENVGRALARKEKILKEEEEKEKELLDRIKVDRNFTISYASKFAEKYSGDYSLLTANWNSKHGNIRIEILPGNELYGEKIEEVTSYSGRLGSLLGYGLHTGSKNTRKRKIKFIGVIEQNLVINYKIKIGYDEPDFISDTVEYSGLGLISSDFTKIHLQEKDKDYKREYYSLEKIT